MSRENDKHQRNSKHRSRYFWKQLIGLRTRFVTLSLALVPQMPDDGEAKPGAWNEQAGGGGPWRPGWALRALVMPSGTS